MADSVYAISRYHGIEFQLHFEHHNPQHLTYEFLVRNALATTFEGTRAIRDASDRVIAKSGYCLGGWSEFYVRQGETIRLVRSQDTIDSVTPFLDKIDRSYQINESHDFYKTVTAGIFTFPISERITREPAKKHPTLLFFYDVDPDCGDSPTRPRSPGLKKGNDVVHDLNLVRRILAPGYESTSNCYAFLGRQSNPSHGAVDEDGKSRTYLGRVVKGDYFYVYLGDVVDGRVVGPIHAWRYRRMLTVSCMFHGCSFSVNTPRYTDVVNLDFSWLLGLEVIKSTGHSMINWYSEEEIDVISDLSVVVMKWINAFMKILGLETWKCEKAYMAEYIPVLEWTRPGRTAEEA